MFEVKIYRETGNVDLVDKAIPYAVEFTMHVIPKIEKSLKYTHEYAKAILKPACNKYGMGYLTDIMHSKYEGSTEVFGCRGIKSADDETIVLLFDTLTEEEYKQEWSVAEIGKLILAFIIGIAFGSFLYFGDKMF